MRHVTYYGFINIEKCPDDRAFRITFHHPYATKKRDKKKRDNANRVRIFLIRSILKAACSEHHSKALIPGLDTLIQPRVE